MPGSHQPPTAVREPSLRERLVSVALAELERVGRPEDVTISAVVSAAQCTPPSLYHYWPTRQSLLLEAAAVGWGRFQASQHTATSRVTDPRARIHGRGRAYLAFARERPTLFRVLFVPQPAPTKQVAGGSPTFGPAFTDLVADVTAAVAAHQVDPGRLSPTDLATALWCAVHGLATLTASDGRDVDSALDHNDPTHERLLAVLEEALLRAPAQLDWASEPMA